MNIKENKNYDKHFFPIIYDYQIFQAQRFGGISRYFCEIIRRLHCEYKIAIRFSLNYYITKWQLNDKQIAFPRFLYKYFSSFFRRRNYHFAKKILKSDNKFLFHPTYYDSYFLKYIGGNPYVVTVHDMVHEKFAHIYPSPKSFREQKAKVIKGATRIIAISENTKKDIIEILGVAPEKIDVVYHGTSMKPFSGEYQLKLPNKYLLYVGDRAAYKNFQRFIEVFSELHKQDPELYLVYTGNKLEESEIKQLPLGIEKYTIHVKASDKALSELYTRALLFVYPSLYEGFGIPILEAYACHCPIAISDTSCFPEVAGEAAAYFDPYSKESMYRTILKVIYDKENRQRLIELGNTRLKRYSWEKAALETQKTYQKAIEESISSSNPTVKKSKSTEYSTTEVTSKSNILPLRTS